MLIFDGPTENRQGELGSLFKYYYYYYYYYHYYYYYYYYYGEHKHSVVGKNIEKQGQKRVNLGKNFYNRQEMLRETRVFDIRCVVDYKRKKTYAKHSSRLHP